MGALALCKGSMSQGLLDPGGRTLTLVPASVPIECLPGHVGAGCPHSCSCLNGGLCDPHTGHCLCLAGWTGDKCQSREWGGAAGQSGGSAEKGWHESHCRAEDCARGGASPGDLLSCECKSCHLSTKGSCSGELSLGSWPVGRVLLPCLGRGVWPRPALWWVERRMLWGSGAAAVPCMQRGAPSPLVLEPVLAVAAVPAGPGSPSRASASPEPRHARATLPHSSKLRPPTQAPNTSPLPAGALSPLLGVQRGRPLAQGCSLGSAV